MLNRAALEAEAQASAERSAEGRAQTLTAGPRQGIFARHALALPLLQTASNRPWPPSTGSAPSLPSTVRCSIEAFVRENTSPPCTPQQLAIIGDTAHRHARVEVDERDVGRTRWMPRPSDQQRRSRCPLHRTRARSGTAVGPESIRTDAPSERNDTRILGVIIALDKTDGLLASMRMIGHVHASCPIHCFDSYNLYRFLRYIYPANGSSLGLDRGLPVLTRDPMDPTTIGPIAHSQGGNPCRIDA